MPDAYPKNAPGPFYVENQCCITCGIPVEIAPRLFSWDDEAEYPGNCFVKQQPGSGAEVDLMLDVMRKTEALCVRYRGTDNAIRQRIIRAGHADQCDDG
jgi:hypothetical protein